MKKPLRLRILERLTGMTLLTKREVDQTLAEGQRRSPVALTASEQINQIVETPYNYSLLIKYATNNEVVRTVHDAIIKEVVRNKWEVTPRWQSKCGMCGSEFQTKKLKCPVCSNARMLEPALEQKTILESFLEDPNPDDEMVDIIKSVLRYMLSVDDWYVSVQYATPEVPLTVYVEDSVNMRVVADKYGRIGNKEYFCPVCTRENPEKTYTLNQHCEKHPDTPLKETAYVLQIGGYVKARFAKDEVMHGKLDPWLPSLYGTSKLISCLRIVMSILAMDNFNLDTYSEGKLAQILVFHGMSQAEANELMSEVSKQKELVTQNPRTGEQNVRKMLTLGLGSKEGVTAVNAMLSSEKMQNLDWWKLWREAVCSMYGGTPIFTGVVESGKTGNNPRMQIDVQNNTTEMYQHVIEDNFNNFIIPKLGVTDWQFKFKPVEEKDEMQDITILQAKIDTVIRATNAGMEAELTDEGEVKISGKPKPLFERFPEGSGFKKPFAEKPSPFKQEELFPTEKAVRKGRSYVVTELEEVTGNDRE